jgi:filamentous hemagglutinin
MGFTAGPPVVMSSSDSDQSTTVAGISGGTIINNGQETAVDSTGRPIDTGVRTGDASGKVENVLDLDKINSEFAIGKTLSQEAGTFLNYRAQEADAAKDRLEKAESSGADSETIALYKEEAKAAAQWSPGGTYRLVFTAVTSALSGNMSGSAAQAMQSAVVTTLQSLGAQEIKDIADDYEKGAGTVKGEALRTALQAIVGCAGAAASGGSCGAGALGASASVVLNNLADLATNTTGSKLTAQEKEARINLLDSLVGGATAAMGGDAAAATLAARVEQENNWALPVPVPAAPPVGVTGKANAANKKAANQLWKLIQSFFKADDQSSAQNPEQGQATNPTSPAAQNPGQGQTTNPTSPASSDQNNTPPVSFDPKIKGQLAGRGWTEEDVKEVVAQGPTGESFDNRSAGKTPDGVPRNDPATVYGSKDGYVVVNDRTGEVVQVSNKNDPEWATDSRIK